MGKEISGLHEAAYLLGFFAVLSQLLALVRDRLLAGSFGAGETLDLYYAAFRIPDAIFVTAASLVSSSILIPFIAEKITRGRVDGRTFMSGLFTVFSFFIVLLSAAAFFAAPKLTAVFFPGLASPPVYDELILLTRIILLQPIFLGLSNLLSSVVQTYKQFFIYALAPVLYNGGIIIGVVFLYPFLGSSGLAWGVVLGAVLHFLIQIPAVVQNGLFPRFTTAINWPEIWRVAGVSLPRTLTLAAGNLSTLFLVSIGSVIGAGSISVFTFAWNLQSVPLSVVGASYSLAAFPTLARLFSNGGREKFIGAVGSSLRHIVFWSAPAAVLFIVLRAQIVRTVLGFGEFSWSDTRLTAASLALFAVSVAAQGVIILLVRAYYAVGRTKTPLVINVVSAAAVVLLALFLVKVFNAVPVFRFFTESLLKVSQVPGTAVLMLPLAYSIVSLANAAALLWAFRRDFGGFGVDFGKTLWQSIGSSIIMGFAAYLFLNVFDDFFNLSRVVGVFAQGLLSGLFGIASGAATLVALGNLEIREVWNTLHHKIWRAKIIGADSTEGPVL